MRSAALVTVGSELTEGLRVDTNTAVIARALAPRGYRVTEAVSVPDDVGLLAAQLSRLCAVHPLVITTGGLGPTHDDVTREAAARALGLSLVRDERLVELLQSAVRRHSDREAGAQVLVQADVLEGARVIDATTGTAPGLVVATDTGELVLLPGPPSEMRPMLQDVIDRLPRVWADHHELGVVGMSESDVQVQASRALAGFDAVGFTVLAKPGDVRVLLLDHGCGAGVLEEAAGAVSVLLGDAVYSTTGASLQSVVIERAIAGGARIAVAESCTGGMVAASLTEVAGSSAAFRGGLVAYDNDVKARVLGVDSGLLQTYGAVSEQCARAMAQRARGLFGADVAVAVTGIAGPGGGSPGKPVGTVWFALSDPVGIEAQMRSFPPTGRDHVRARACSVALDLLRRAVRA